MTDRRVALVTGAGRGIGRSIALELATHGFAVVGNDILFDPDNTHSGLFEVQQRMADLKASFLPVKGDVADLCSHKKMLAEAHQKFGKVDVLINNAGIAPEERLDVLETTPESFDRLMEVNARGAFFLTQRVARQMIARIEEDSTSHPSIIFVSSISAVVSSTHRAEYCISKAALSQTARVFAHRLAEYGITVFEVRPGIIQTEMTQPVRGKYDALIQEGLVPQKRWGFPQDVGKAVAALARGDFAYSTGLILEVSGGMNIRRL